MPHNIYKSITMRKNWGINLLLISILITSIGSVCKIMQLRIISEVLLWIGMITFVVALYGIVRFLFFGRQVQ